MSEDERADDSAAPEDADIGMRVVSRLDEQEASSARDPTMAERKAGRRFIGLKNGSKAKDRPLDSDNREKLQVF
jgi:hypothetical protein